MAATTECISVDCVQESRKEEVERLVSAGKQDINLAERGFGYKRRRIEKRNE
jgi:hypothetical protein